MGHKIFVSYKYSDSDVRHIKGESWESNTVRNYVDVLQEKLGESNQIYKGESDDEDLSQLSDETIWQKLRDRIYDSTLTIVLISKTNAMLAVVIPDKNDSYQYYTYMNNCCNTKCRTLLTNTLFKILHKNMFNSKNPNISDCQNGSKIYHGDSSYICSVEWDTFTNDMDLYINKAYEIQDNIDDYEIYKEVE